ncbi:MAG: efflux RND transporter permease subunit, partial [Thermaurantiacus tibetensis]
MLRRLVEIALAQRLAVLGLALALAGLGVWAFRTLPIDAFPDISPTQVKLILKAPGLTPEEVEARVIVPLEQELLGIPGQRVLRSIAKVGLADITIDFAESTDIYWARQQVAERFAAAGLPAGVEGGLAPISTPLSDMFMFTIEGPLSLAEKRRLLDWTIRPALRTVPGVADVNALGGEVEAFLVVPRPEALAAARIPVSELVGAIEAANRNDGAGRVADGEFALVVRATAAIRDLPDLAAVPVRAVDGRIVRVGDVADVRMGALTRQGAVTRSVRGEDGTIRQAEAVQGIVIGLRGANAAQVVGGVKARLAELAPALPPGVRLVPFYDRSDLISRAVGTVERALVEASILVVLLLFLFLGEVRAALIVTAALPMAALLTFILMKVFGLSANLMSLGGLAIAIGLLVDGAVVVVENVVERLSDPRHRGTGRLNQVLVATSEVIQPVVSGIAIIILVFLPLLTLEGLEGRLFAPVALTIVMALAGSLLLALTLVPVLASLGLRSPPPGEAHHQPWLMRRIAPAYDRLLAFALGRPGAVAAVAVAALALAVLAYGRVGKSFLPTLDEGTVLVQLTKDPSIGLAHSIAGDLAVQRTILETVPEVTAIVARVGSDEIGLDPMGLNETDSFLVLKPREAWRRPDKEWLVGELRRVVAAHPGIEPGFTQPIEMRVSEMLTGARGDLALRIFGPDLGELAQLATRIEGVIAAVPGATDVITRAADTVDYLAIEVDRLAAGRAGITAQELQEALRVEVEGMPAGVVAEGLRRVPIVVRGAGADAARLAGQPLATTSGTLVRPGDVARIAPTEGPARLEHEGGSRFALVQAFVSGRDLVGFVTEAQARVAAEVPLPEGVRLAWGGQFENQQRAAARLAIVVPAALALIFLLLYAT